MQQRLHLKRLNHISKAQEQCCQVTVKDEGSRTMCVPIQVEGVLTFGLLDTGADITIIGARLFREVAAMAKLKKRPANQIPRGYDGKPFAIHGQMEMTLAFDGRDEDHGLCQDRCDRSTVII